MNSYEIIKIDNSTWRIEDNGVRFFLLSGDDYSLLIDTGMNVKNVKAIAQSLTDKPIKLINTHADPDHIGANCEFSSFMMNTLELDNYNIYQKCTSQVIPVNDHEIINIGGRSLEVIFIPGHTPGSIALLDIERRVLFSGDTIQAGNIFLFGPMRNIKTYLKSLERLNTLKDQFDFIYPSHANPVLEPNIIEKLIEGTKAVIDNKLSYSDASLFGQKIKVYDIGCAKLLLN